MLLDPGVGFFVVHEFAGLAPRPQAAGRKVQLTRPFRCAEIIDGHTPEKLGIAPRLEDFPTAIQQGRQIDLGCKAIGKCDRGPISVQRSNCGDFLQKIVRFQLFKSLNFPGRSTGSQLIPCVEKLGAMLESPAANHRQFLCGDFSQQEPPGFRWRWKSFRWYTWRENEAAGDQPRGSACKYRFRKNARV